jgi:transcriptional regulator, AraC family with amidase-like domain
MHRIGYFLTHGFQVMAIGTQTVFEMANIVARETVYEITNYSLAGGEVRSSVGVSVQTEKATAAAEADTWMVSGIVNPLIHATPPAELAYLREASARARRTVGLCTGTFVLAEAGLLQGRRVTTHWAYAEELRKRCEGVQVDADRIFIVDGPIWTSAGLTAAMDLALGIVDKDLGPELASSVAHVMVMPHRRAGGQSQHSEMLKMAPKSERIHLALNYARQHLARPLTVDDLAEAAHLSPRQFSRVFQAETGRTPAKAIEMLRIEQARNMIERGRHSLDVIARETGFRDRKHLREAFLRGYGVTPLSLRRNARAEEAMADA